MYWIILHNLSLPSIYSFVLYMFCLGILLLFLIFLDCLVFISFLLNFYNYFINIYYRSYILVDYEYERSYEVYFHLFDVVCMRPISELNIIRKDICWLSRLVYNSR